MEMKTINKVRAILLRQGRIAVIQSKKSGAFMLPGGKVELEESQEETLEREVLEELGIKIDNKEIVGPFCKIEFLGESIDESGKSINKKIITSYYIANTTQDFDYTKMNLTEREKARGSRPYWVNPSKLEYVLTYQRDNYKSSYASRYAKEFLDVYNKFKNYQKQKQRESENDLTK